LADNRRMSLAHGAAAAETALPRQIADAIAAAGGWLPFDQFMQLALYAPGLGYYAHGSPKFGALPASGSDFITAPELSPLFGRALAAQVAQSLRATGTHEVWEFGAGSGALAEQLITGLQALGQPLARYTIVELSASLRARQQERLAPLMQAQPGLSITWADSLPDSLRGVVVGNEVLDAMPVQLLARVGGQWHERGVAWHEDTLVWADRPTTLRPPFEVEGEHDYVTEIHPQGEAFIATLAEAFARNVAQGGPGGCALLLDYGFPEAEYYHPERQTGTLACHQLHLMDDNPLIAVGEKDITAHVNFTGMAVAAQEAGMELLGYTSQGRFLLNCGLTERMAQVGLPQRIMAQRLLLEHEMGELFKVIGWCAGPPWPALGFAVGDRSHRL